MVIIGRFSYDDSTNRNENLLLDFTSQHNLIIGNTNFLKPRPKLWTYQFPNRTLSQIDFILYRKRWRNIVPTARHIPAPTQSVMIIEWSLRMLKSAYPDLNLPRQKSYFGNPSLWTRISPAEWITQFPAVGYQESSGYRAHKKIMTSRYRVMFWWTRYE